MCKTISNSVQISSHFQGEIGLESWKMRWNFSKFWPTFVPPLCNLSQNLQNKSYKCGFFTLDYQRTCVRGLKGIFFVYRWVYEVSLVDSFFSANNALKPSTRPPFDSYFHALQEKWGIKHFIETFRRIQGRQMPRASKSWFFCRFFMKIGNTGTLICLSMSKKFCKN